MADQVIEPLALRPKAAAKALGVSTRTLWSWTHPRGSIRCVRAGSGRHAAVLYQVVELKRWLAQQTGVGTKAAEREGAGDEA